MKITYEFDLTALCRNEPHARNYYQATVVGSKLVWAERLQKFAEAQADEAISQEDLTQLLARTFPNTYVSLVGQHGAIRITSQDRCD